MSPKAEPKSIPSKIGEKTAGGKSTKAVAQKRMIKIAEIQLLCFTINDEEYGIDINKVEEISRSVEVTKIADAPAYVTGVIDFKGNPITVIDLRTRLGYTEQDDDKNTRIIVLDFENKMWGLKVDNVTEIMRITESQVEKGQEKAKMRASRFLKGIIKKEDGLVFIIDGQKLTKGM
ncbi:MAG: chemotaxis protein CheW [Candidatus Zixiibacteriota bacterium]